MGKPVRIAYPDAYPILSSTFERLGNPSLSSLGVGYSRIRNCGRLFHSPSHRTAYGRSRRRSQRVRRTKPSRCPESGLRDSWPVQFRFMMPRKTGRAAACAARGSTLGSALHQAVLALAGIRADDDDDRRSSRRSPKAVSSSISRFSYRSTARLKMALRQVFAI